MGTNNCEDEDLDLPLGFSNQAERNPDVCEPKSAEEALTSPHSREWKTAMDEEIAQLRRRGT